MRKIDTTLAIKRAKSDYLESILGHAFPVLDHGFVRVIDYMGDDHSIDEAARMSYGQGTRQTNEAQGLINTLMRKGHTSPFEMCELKLHLKMPIFVMRQWVRHRMASLNEYSARYSVLKDEFYLPPLEQLRKQSKTNKQGRDVLITGPKAQSIYNSIEMHSKESYQFYENLLMTSDDDEDDVGLARELARICLPVNVYTELYWKIDLHNLLKLLGLRNDSHAQWEIQQYAETIETHGVKPWVPMIFKAYQTYIKEAVTFSGKEMKLLRLALYNPTKMDPETIPTYPGMDENPFSKREWREFVEKVRKAA